MGISAVPARLLRPPAESPTRKSEREASRSARPRTIGPTSAVSSANRSPCVPLRDVRQTITVHCLNRQRIVRRLLKLTFVGLLAWATYYVTQAGTNLGSIALKVAAASIAISAGLQFLDAVSDWLSANILPVKRNVDQLLLNRLSAIYRTKILACNPATISMHVWEVPIWFRRIFPYNTRQHMRQIFPRRMHKFAWRPKLARIGQGECDDCRHPE